MEDERITSVGKLMVVVVTTELAAVRHGVSAAEAIRADWPLYLMKGEAGPPVIFSEEEWRQFITQIKNGEHDLPGPRAL